MPLMNSVGVAFTPPSRASSIWAARRSFIFPEARHACMAAPSSPASVAIRTTSFISGFSSWVEKTLSWYGQKPFCSWAQRPPMASQHAPSWIVCLRLGLQSESRG